MTVATLTALALVFGCREPVDEDRFAAVPFEAGPPVSKEPVAAPPPLTLGEAALAVYLEQVQTVDRFADSFSGSTGSELACEELTARILAARDDAVNLGEEARHRLAERLRDASRVDLDVAWRIMRGEVGRQRLRLEADPRLSLGAKRARCPEEAPSLEAASSDVLGTLADLTTLVDRAGSERPIIYRIVREGRGNIYLFGSIHAGSASLFPLPKLIEEAFESSEVVGVEVDMTSLDRRTARRLQDGTRLPEGVRCISEIVPAELFERVQESLTRAGIPTDAIRGLRPVTIAHVILERFGGPHGLNPAAGMEAVLVRKAREEGKEVIALETFDEQISALYMQRLGRQMEIKVLAASLDAAPDMDGMTIRLTSAWRRGDEEFLSQVRTFWQRYDPALRAYDEEIFGRRDARMSQRIARMMRDDRTHFLMVGAGHLVGEGSIVTHLRARGIEVERL